ncbi:hypothetical protein WN944_023880 [Citrus x changshan-huyou]|uniref:Uncharacterized protein n=1 Tax=Citrus x changshan-huyou TaxID=2935761 RepID=A0AAP0LRC9_9ROSI
MRPLPLVRNYPLEGKVILPHRARAARDGPLVQIVVGGDSGLSLRLTGAVSTPAVPPTLAGISLTSLLTKVRKRASGTVLSQP